MFCMAVSSKKVGGAIAVIGATEKGLAGEAGDFISTGNDRFNVNFFLSYEPGITVGEMFFRAKQDYMINAFPILSECINIEVFTLIGDPVSKSVDIPHNRGIFLFYYIMLKPFRCFWFYDV